MSLGTAQVIQGNALALPLPDSSVDLICTSPPYFGLRSYQDAGAHYQGQLGSEATPAEFLDALIAATREMVRVLKPSGSIFVNLGDKYAGSRMDGSSDNGTGSTSLVGTASIRDRAAATGRPKSRTTIPTKSLMGIPWRYAIRCIDTTQGVPVPIVREMVAAVYNGNLDPYACDEILKEYETGGRNAGLGLILRAEIIWSKPNGLPESVTDRVRRSHEQWFHFTVQPRYFAAVDEIREPHGHAEHMARYSERAKSYDFKRNDDRVDKGATILPGHPLGKLPGSVWSIPSQPLTVPPELGVDHFAAYPMEWPRRIILGWTPTGICVECGEGRRPVTLSEKVTSRPGYNVRDQRMPGRHASGNQGHEGRAGDYLATITGYACACPTPTAPTRPAVVLDPFGGTGTTALVAKALGRTGITIDLSADYCRLAQWRCNNPQELAAALQVEKPDVVPDDQLSLFETP